MGEKGWRGRGEVGRVVRGTGKGLQGMGGVAEASYEGRGREGVQLEI